MEINSDRRLRIVNYKTKLIFQLHDYPEVICVT